MIGRLSRLKPDHNCADRHFAQVGAIGSSKLKADDDLPLAAALSQLDESLAGTLRHAGRRGEAAATARALAALGPQASQQSVCVAADGRRGAPPVRRIAARNTAGRFWIAVSPWQIGPRAFATDPAGQLSCEIGAGSMLRFCVRQIKVVPHRSYVVIVVFSPSILAGWCCRSGYGGDGCDAAARSLCAAQAQRPGRFAGPVFGGGGGGGSSCATLLYRVVSSLSCSSDMCLSKSSSICF